MEEKPRRRRRNRQKRKLLTKTQNIVVWVVAIALAIGVFFTINHVLPNFKSEDFRSYFSFSKDAIQTVLEDEYIKTDNPPVMQGDNLYISYDFVKANIDQYVYWDDNLKKLTITTSDKVIRFTADQTTYYVNSKPMKMNIPVNIINGSPYIPASLLESLYLYTFDYQQSTNILIVDDSTKDKIVASTIPKRVDVRYDSDKKSLITTTLVPTSPIVVFAKGDKYTKIRTNTGILGYVKNNQIGNQTTISGRTPAQDYYSTPLQGKISMEWDQITNVDANSTPQSRTVDTGVNVLSPTWFKFDRDSLNGDIITLADKDYVNWAHQNNIQVWGLLSDVTDKYDSVVSHAILPDTDKREHAIKQILAYMAMYNLDGINIDFEQIKPEDADSYLQFFRELYPYMKAEGKVLSVDMYVPAQWSKYYNRTEVSKSVDYVCLMAYDEHTNGENIGPVASINFVEQGIRDSLDEIPKDKLILGLPMFCRIWATTTQGDGTTKDALSGNAGMDTTKNKFLTNGTIFTWQDDTGYNYGEYKTTVDGKDVTYKTWLEDLQSLELKLKLYQKYDLKGVAGWQRALAGAGTWDLVSKYVK